MKPKNKVYKPVSSRQRGREIVFFILKLKKIWTLRPGFPPSRSLHFWRPSILPGSSGHTPGPSAIRPRHKTCLHLARFCPLTHGTRCLVLVFFPAGIVSVLLSTRALTLLVHWPHIYENRVLQSSRSVSPRLLLSLRLSLSLSFLSLSLPFFCGET